MSLPSKITFSAIIIIIALLFTFTILPWLMLYIGLALGEDPPKPVYTYGEFPFYLEYEINGEVVIVEDTVIVKYDGIGLSEGSGGKYIKWKNTLASGNKEVIIYQSAQGETLIFNLINKKYHLKDELIDQTKIPAIIKREGGLSSSVGSNVKLMNEYGIRIIKFEYGTPIRKSE